MRPNLIVAVDNRWGIGKDGSLLASIPEDMKFFRQKTLGNTIIMGRKTLESFPNKEPLKNRTNVVLTTNNNYKADGVVILHSLKEVINLCNEKNDDTESIYVIGGASIYEQLLPYCALAFVTKIHSTFEADSYFPNIDKDDNWRIIERSELHEYDGIGYEFLTYVNMKWVKENGGESLCQYN